MFAASIQGEGVLAKSKPQSSLDITQAWFTTGKPICGPGSCMPPHACRFSEPGLSYIRHCHADWFPIDYRNKLLILLWTQDHQNNLLISLYTAYSPTLVT